jgi:hypothetical protein
MEAAMAHAASAAVAPNPSSFAAAEKLGVSCTACHLEAGHIVGSGSADPKRAPHPVSVSASLSDPALCARCHQFGSGAAVNGKPLENTHAEWQASRWGQAGATCQSCHMPGGEHLFQGIHTPDFVRTGVEVSWESRGRSGRLLLANTNVGHAFPSYATPQVELVVQPEDGQGRPRGPPRLEVIGRRVHFVEGAWHEQADTRVLPGATAVLDYAFSTEPAATVLHASVRVEPDFGYIEIYRDMLLRPGLPRARRAQLEAALAAAQRSGYQIFDERRPLPGP